MFNPSVQIVNYENPQKKLDSWDSEKKNLSYYGEINTWKTMKRVDPVIYEMGFEEAIQIDSEIFIKS